MTTVMILAECGIHEEVVVHAMQHYKSEGRYLTEVEELTRLETGKHYTTYVGHGRFINVAIVPKGARVSKLTVPVEQTVTSYGDIPGVEPHYTYEPLDLTGTVSFDFTGDAPVETKTTVTQAPTQEVVSHPVGGRLFVEKFEDNPATTGPAG